MPTTNDGDGGSDAGGSWLARVRFPGEGDDAFLTLTRDWAWEPSDPDDPLMQAMAALATAGAAANPYSPADGYMGARHARSVADAFGGVVELPEYHQRRRADGDDDGGGPVVY